MSQKGKWADYKTEVVRDVLRGSKRARKVATLAAHRIGAASGAGKGVGGTVSHHIAMGRLPRQSGVGSMESSSTLSLPAITVNSSAAASPHPSASPAVAAAAAAAGAGSNLGAGLDSLAVASTSPSPVPGMSCENLKYRRLRDSLPDYMSFIKSEATMDAEEAMGLFDERIPNEIVLDNMFLCDNQSQYIEFWQRAAILKLNLRSSKGDDEYIDMQLLDDIYHKWNQIAKRFHAVCGRFTHSSFLAVICDMDSPARANLESAAAMLQEMEQVAKACVAESSRTAAGSAMGGICGAASTRTFSRMSFMSHASHDGDAWAAGATDHEKTMVIRTATSSPSKHVDAASGAKGAYGSAASSPDGRGSRNCDECVGRDDDDDDDYDEADRVNDREEAAVEDNIQDIVILGALLSGDVFVTIRGPGKFVTQLYGEGNDRADRLITCTSVAQLSAHDFKNFVTTDVRVDEPTAIMLQGRFDIHPIYTTNAPQRRRSSLVDVFIQAREERSMPKVSYRGRNRAVIQQLLDEQVESIVSDQNTASMQGALYHQHRSRSSPSPMGTPMGGSPVMTNAGAHHVSVSDGGMSEESWAPSPLRRRNRGAPGSMRGSPVAAGAGGGAGGGVRATGFRLGARIEEAFPQQQASPPAVASIRRRNNFHH